MINRTFVSYLHQESMPSITSNGSLCTGLATSVKKALVKFCEHKAQSQSAVSALLSNDQHGILDIFLIPLRLSIFNKRKRIDSQLEWIVVRIKLENIRSPDNKLNDSPLKTAHYHHYDCFGQIILYSQTDCGSIVHFVI